MKQVKDFKKILEDLKPYVKNPRGLLNGREFGNFSLRPREVWANWLLCVVLRHIYGEDITFAEDKKNDGIILNKETKKWIRAEHVSALENPRGQKLPKGEDRIIEAIDHKINKGVDYAKDKILVVFFDGAGVFYRNKIRENIAGRHNFDLVYCIGLLSVDKNGYAYSVTEFHKEYSITYKVQINTDFTDWEISQIKG